MIEYRFWPEPDRTASSVCPPVVAGAPTPRDVSGVSSRISASFVGVSVGVIGEAVSGRTNPTDHADAAAAAVTTAQYLLDDRMYFLPHSREMSSPTIAPLSREKRARKYRWHLSQKVRT
jgi:hypothetical protein